MECNSIQSSSSSSTMRKYDVFVSFRGEDIRNNFADHLFGAFQRKGIVAFRDDRSLKQGARISTELMQAIEGSQVLIVVFSRNYATSTWCLQELAKIVDCLNMEVPTGQIVLPVFYDVSPSELRKQSGDYGKALADHEQKYKQDLGMVQRWREALMQVAGISGWDVQNNNIKQLWKGTKPLDNLKIINLSYSQNLVKTPDFSGAPNLEELVLQGCTKLVHIHPSIGRLRKLVDLNLENCTSLKSLPSSIFHVSSLARVNLLGCSKLFHSEQFGSARHGVSETAIQSQSTISSIFKRLKLVLPFHFFNSRRHNDIVGSLMLSLARLSSLRSLDLSYCNLLNIPEAIALLYCLQILRLRGNKFVTLPCFIKELPRLRTLDLEHCKQLTSLYEFPLRANLRRPNHWGYSARLSIFDCPKLVERASWSRIALSWMIQFLKVYKESTSIIDIVVPGDRIPSWFNRQTVGDSITIEPFLNVHDNNWIGIVFCATFIAHYDPPSSSDAEERPEIWCSFQPQKPKGAICLDRPVAQIEETNGTAVELVHLYLSYVKRKGLISHMEFYGLHDLDGCRFKFEVRRRGHDLHLEVKNWGMRVVFKQDLEELNGDG